MWVDNLRRAMAEGGGQKICGLNWLPIKLLWGDTLPYPYPHLSSNAYDNRTLVMFFKKVNSYNLISHAIFNPYIHCLYMFVTCNPIRGFDKNQTASLKFRLSDFQSLTMMCSLWLLMATKKLIDSWNTFSRCASISCCW